MSLNQTVPMNGIQKRNRWHDVRLIGGVAGRYVLPQRRLSPQEQLPSYSASLRSISTRSAVIDGGTVGEVGEWVGCHFNELGLLRGKINRKLHKGFVLDVVMSEKETDRLAGRIEWLKRRQIENLEDQRDYKRLAPRTASSLLLFADGSRMPCQIIDYSQSGMSISAPHWPDIGTPLAVGTVVGRVVRHFEEGFAVRFISIQDPEGLEQKLMPPLAIQHGDLLVTDAPKIRATG